MSSELLPLFPLQVVLLPGMSLPLHIFEPRYRLMIRTCIERKAEFGVVLASGDEMAEVGCSAEIVKVAREFSDGRFNVLTVGRRRFRLEGVSSDLAYLQGRVKFLVEEGPAAGAEEPSQLPELWPEVYRLVAGEQHPPEPGPEFPHLSYFIAATLPLDLEVRQAVLEAPGESQRIALLESKLRDWLPRLRRITRMKAKAAGNGHG